MSSLLVLVRKPTWATSRLSSTSARSLRLERREDLFGMRTECQFMDTGFCEMAVPTVDAVVAANHLIDRMTALVEYGQQRTSIQASEPTVSGQPWTTPTFRCTAAMASSLENMFQDGRCTNTWKTTQSNTDCWTA
jgi:hypothetical protein